MRMDALRQLLDGRIRVGFRGIWLCGRYCAIEAYGGISGD